MFGTPLLVAKMVVRSSCSVVTCGEGFGAGYLVYLLGAKKKVVIVRWRGCFEQEIRLRIEFNGWRREKLLAGQV